MELVRQDMRRQEKEMHELLNKLTSLEEDNLKLKESIHVEQRLRNSISELEDQIAEKNKVIKRPLSSNILLYYSYIYGENYRFTFEKQHF